MVVHENFADAMDEELVLKLDNMKAGYELANKIIEDKEAALAEAETLYWEAAAEYGSWAIAEDIPAAVTEEKIKAERRMDVREQLLEAAKANVDTTIRTAVTNMTLDELYSNMSNAATIYDEKWNTLQDAIEAHAEAERVAEAARKQNLYASSNATNVSDDDYQDLDLKETDDVLLATAAALEIAKEEAAEAAENAKLASMALEIKREEEEKVRLEDMTYVVHTARSYCPYGLRPSFVGLPISNGVFIKGIPQMTVADCVPDVNLINFGGCRSLKNEKIMDMAKIVVEMARNDSAWYEKPEIAGLSQLAKLKKDGGIDVTVLEKCAAVCEMKFGKNEKWGNGHSKVFINGVPALLRRSEITCVYGGTIILETSGQPKS